MKEYLEGVQVGDRLWDFYHGWGTVTKVNLFTSEDMIIFKEDKYGQEFSYRIDGKSSRMKIQTLFWNKIKYDIPIRPLSKTAIVNLFKPKAPNDDGVEYTIAYHATLEKWFVVSFKYVRSFSEIYYTEQQAMKIAELLNEHKIK